MFLKPNEQVSVREAFQWNTKKSSFYLKLFPAGMANEKRNTTHKQILYERFIRRNALNMKDIQLKNNN